MLIAAMLICCSSPHCVGLTPLTYGENLTCSEPRGKGKIGDSWVALDTRLPWYTSGFE